MKKQILLLAFLASIFAVSSTEGEKKPIDTYGWQSCKCYQIYGGPAYRAVLVANSYCINSGHPKPAGCL